MGLDKEELLELERSCFMKEIEEIWNELQRAKRKYPTGKFPVWGENTKQMLYERVGLVACEAGEALNAANKYYFNGDQNIENIRLELIQTASTAIRVLMSF